MCLAIPGKIIEINTDSPIKMGKIDYAGTVNDACLEYVPEAEVGQYVIVHAGFALNIVDEEEAKKTLSLWDEIVEKAAEEGLDVFGMPLENSKKEPGESEGS
jgi:hydrogenase expression/formation protein HypC